MLARHDLVDHDLSSLRYITNTGAPLPSAHIRFLRAALPQVKIFSMYGLTECKRVSYLPPSEIDARPDSVGRPMDNVEVFVADDSGRLSTTGVGELVVRGSNVMRGTGTRQSNRQVLKPGPLPGQHLLLHRRSLPDRRQGYMYFEARLDDVLKCRGQRVSPKEVENALYEISGVTGAAVFGISDELFGTAVKALAWPSIAAVLFTAHDVLRYCAVRLEDFMVPKEIEFVDHLMTTESGKIIKRRPAGGRSPKDLDAATRGISDWRRRTAAAGRCWCFLRSRCFAMVPGGTSVRCTPTATSCR